MKKLPAMLMPALMVWCAPALQAMDKSEIKAFKKANFKKEIAGLTEEDKVPFAPFELTPGYDFINNRLPIQIGLYTNPNLKKTTLVQGIQETGFISAGLRLGNGMFLDANRNLHFDVMELMDLVEELVTTVAMNVFGTLKIEHSEDKVIDLTRPWKRAPYKELVKEKAGEDWFDVSKEERVKRAQELGLKVDISE